MPKKTKIETESQTFTCSNPECGKIFNNPIIVQDLSSKNNSSYYACPYCLTEIMIEKTLEVEEGKQKRKAKRTKIEQAKTHAIETKSTLQLSPEIHKCPHHFGYLSQRSKSENIPEECMICEKIVQCMLKKITG